MNKPGTNLAVLCGLATNPAAPPWMLLRLAAHPYRGFLAPSGALLGREHLPPEVARALAGHPDAEVRRRLAAHPSTPDEVRCVLAGDAEPDVRAEVAAWPGSWVDSWRPRPVTAPPLPVEVYRGLAADTEPSVRAAVGMNRHAPEVVRAELAGDADPEVRRCAALNRLPPAVLHALMGDADHHVRQTALSTAAIHAPQATIPEDLAALFEQHSAYHWEEAFAMVELTPSLLTRLYAEGEHVVLARNPSLPVGHMRAFLDDADLRPALASNPGLPEHLLEELVATEDPEAHRELLRRHELPDRLRRRLIAADEDGEPLPMVTSLLPGYAGLQERLSYLDHPNPAFRRTLAVSPDLPSDAVRRLAEDPDFSTRLLVCERHDDVPPAALIGLLEDWGGHSRADLLRHPRLPVETLAGYASTDRPADRKAIASRPDLPPELAVTLLTDPEPEVRRAAAANPNLPGDRLHQLLTDPGHVLREGAASNPMLPADEMERLLADS